MSQQKAFEHMVAWSIQHLFDTYKEANEILSNEALSETEKITRLKAPWGPDHRMLSLLLLLKPALEEAIKAYPEQEKFWEWFKERWTHIEGLNILKGPCGCKGCKVVDAVS